MTDPTPETIAAALRLAAATCAMSEAVDDRQGVPGELFDRLWAERCNAMSAYRASLPKPRTRAEVDAELVSWVRECVTAKRHINLTWERVLSLCSEPTRDDSGPGDEP